MWNQECFSSIHVQHQWFYGPPCFIHILSSVRSRNSYRVWTSSSTTCPLNPSSFTKYLDPCFNHPFLLSFLLYSSAITDSINLDLFGENLKNSPISVTQPSMFLISSILWHVWHKPKLSHGCYSGNTVHKTSCSSTPFVWPLKLAAPSYVCDTVPCKPNFRSIKVCWISITKGLTSVLIHTAHIPLIFQLASLCLHIWKVALTAHCY